MWRDVLDFGFRAKGTPGGAAEAYRELWVWSGVYGDLEFQGLGVPGFKLPGILLPSRMAEINAHWRSVFGDLEQCALAKQSLSLTASPLRCRVLKHRRRAS